MEGIQVLVYFDILKPAQRKVSKIYHRGPPASKFKPNTSCNVHRRDIMENQCFYRLKVEVWQALKKGIMKSGSQPRLLFLASLNWHFAVHELLNWGYQETNYCEVKCCSGNREYFNLEIMRKTFKWKERYFNFQVFAQSLILIFVYDSQFILICDVFIWSELKHSQWLFVPRTVLLTPV